MLAAVTQGSLTVAVAESLSPGHAGFLSGCTCEGLQTAYRWPCAYPGHFPVSSRLNADRRRISDIFLRNVCSGRRTGQI